ncbi:hypothetical protein Glove_217g225 [Diversispora epigaea]|uniref:Uncharacterized protein n=1 Tax=Diversispora epigaea TaxID=1348612 RepID=A0A397IH13_9GLOM|nr:hypothetical protein Glove_217g225 [Diversispora epigaea]
MNKHMQTIGMVVVPFLPLFTAVMNIVKSLNIICENAKYNERICKALLVRVEIIQHVVNSLLWKKKENVENFREQNYYHAWVRLIDVLTNIENFAKAVTQQAGLQKYSNANFLQQSFDRNIKEFKSVCTELQFKIALYSTQTFAVEPFLPLFSTVTNVVDGLYTTYENAKCNKKICLALIDCVEIVQQAVKSLVRRQHQQENVENFRNQTYYHSWIRFINVLKIKLSTVRFGPV